MCFVLKISFFFDSQNHKSAKSSSYIQWKYRLKMLHFKVENLWPKNILNFLFIFSKKGSRGMVSSKNNRAMDIFVYLHEYIAPNFIYYQFKFSIIYILYSSLSRFIDWFYNAPAGICVQGGLPCFLHYIWLVEVFFVE